MSVSISLGQPAIELHAHTATWAWASQIDIPDRGKEFTAQIRMATYHQLPLSLKLKFWKYGFSYTGKESGSHACLSRQENSVEVWRSRNECSCQSQTDSWGGSQRSLGSWNSTFSYWPAQYCDSLMGHTVLLLWRTSLQCVEHKACAENASVFCIEVSRNNWLSVS